jgi:hypothetical protein
VYLQFATAAEAQAALALDGELALPACQRCRQSAACF